MKSSTSQPAGQAWRRCVAALALLPACCAAGGLTVLHAFDGNDGASPQAPLVQGTDGRYYGTTANGGAAHDGTAFSVGADGSFRSLLAFDGSDGSDPYAALVARTDGSLVGSAPLGHYPLPSRPSFGGVVYTLTPQGALQTLRRFPARGPDGQAPGALVDGGDGYWYGTMTYGGAGGGGTVFKIAPDGSLATLHAFMPDEGATPVGDGLTRGSDGNFYGLLRTGPAFAYNGAIFMITPAGAFSVLHTFPLDGSEGGVPAGRLIETPPGTFYGAAQAAGSGGGGTLFRFDAAHRSVTTLHAYNRYDGDAPTGVVSGPDGQLYGMTQGGGTAGLGTIFRITPNGQLTVLRLLQTGDGTGPRAAPVFGSDGRLYGTTAQGGAGNAGTLFSLDVLDAQPPALTMTKTCPTEFDRCDGPINVPVGVPYSVQWSSANLDGCMASGAWSGPRTIGGCIDVTPLQRGLYTYRLTCRGAAGPVSASVTVSVG
ncbi:MAG: hypothetical protein JSR59_12810 [Proteobacteria bacterium]|nr:hypothetical protein [Pseudomonadota bacterium]